MFKFDNTHIFTGYLKQKLSSINIPTCKIYTREFANYLATHGKEDPRVVESIDTVVYDEKNKQLASRVNYLKDDTIYNYFINRQPTEVSNWKQVNTLYYNQDKAIPGLTRKLNSAGSVYDKTTHEYLGEYLRFLRDYHDINLMSLYNCFNNTICNNLSIEHTDSNNNTIAVFDSYDTKYKIYAIPVKLFSKYTIAIDSYHGFEVICGFYNNYSYTHTLDASTVDAITKSKSLYSKTYLKVSKSMFCQPVLFDKLAVENWSYQDELDNDNAKINFNKITRWDILNREQDFKMFIKVPAACKSSIVILEGDFRYYNKASYCPKATQNLNMINCSEGSKVFVTGNIPSTIQSYTLSPWKKFFYNVANASDIEDLELENTTSTEGICQEIVSALEYHETSENIELKKMLWDKGVKKPSNYELAEEKLCLLIESAEELAYVIKNGGKTSILDENNKEIEVRNYKLKADIYINDPAKINWEDDTKLDTEYIIRKWFTSEDVVAFSGTIDGEGHVIYGLYSKPNKASSYAGLIPLIDVNKTTCIKNLGINYAIIEAQTASSFVGGSSKNTNSVKWQYSQNHSIINLDSTNRIDNNSIGFKPISRLQLLAFNTEESYPFADRLVEYLVGSAITPTDEIADNIKRVQNVMMNNQHYFKINGVWEDKIQKIIYDYIMTSGPMDVSNNGVVDDKRLGYHASLGHRSKSTLYDILGYVDKDAEKWYASWSVDNNKAVVTDTIQNTNIYGKLYDI